MRLSNNAWRLIFWPLLGFALALFANTIAARAADTGGPASCCADYAGLDERLNALEKKTKKGAFAWTGPYIGAHAGIVIDGHAGYADGEDAIKSDIDDDGIYGLQAGYQHQLGQFVLGAEASASFSNAKGVFREGGGQLTSELGNVYALTGRVGYVPFERWQVYGKAGWAWVDVDAEAVLFPSADPIKRKLDFDGPVVGGGVEYAITDNVILGLEYLHYNFGNASTEIEETAIKADTGLDTVTARVNFKF